MQNFSVRRRAVVMGAVSMLPALQVNAQAKPQADIRARIAPIEQRVGGEFGIAVLDTGSGKHIELRNNQRFPLCSTFKFLAVAAVLKRVDTKELQIDQFVHYGEPDLLDYAPISKRHVKEGGLSLGALCAAAIQYSDNTAANLLLNAIGGPPALTHYARSLGDSVTRLDRNEPTLNDTTAGDPRDTTSPSAMLGCMNTILLGDALSATSRQQLQTWMIGNTTGAERLRAGLPPAWKIGDKTGSGQRGALNDIAIAWPGAPRAPVLMAVYFVGSKASADERNAALAEIGRIIVDLI